MGTGQNSGTCELPLNGPSRKSITSSHKKVLLHQCKRHTTLRVASTRCAVLVGGWYPPYSPGQRGGYPIQSWSEYPPPGRDMGPSTGVPPGNYMGPVGGSFRGWRWGTRPVVNRQTPVKTVLSPFSLLPTRGIVMMNSCFNYSDFDGGRRRPEVRRHDRHERRGADVSYQYHLN